MIQLRLSARLFRLLAYALRPFLDFVVLAAEGCGVAPRDVDASLGALLRLRPLAELSATEDDSPFPLAVPGASAPFWPVFFLPLGWGGAELLAFSFASSWGKRSSDQHAHRRQTHSETYGFSGNELNQRLATSLKFLRSPRLDEPAQEAGVSPQAGCILEQGNAPVETEAVPVQHVLLDALVGALRGVAMEVESAQQETIFFLRVCLSFCLT